MQIMKTRPHIVTQTGLYNTAGLTRIADLLAARMGTVAGLKDVLTYSRVLIRIMKIILDLTLHNNCFVRRRDVLDSPRLRRVVMERLGGAHALLRWRRQDAWNTARLAAIASGEYRPVSGPDIQPAFKADAERKPASEGQVSSKISAPVETPPSKFRLPVLQNLHYVHRPRIITKHRAKPQKRFPAIVLWPHELDGQYVPDFKSRTQRPDGGGYATDDPAPPPAGHSARAIFAPP